MGSRRRRICFPFPATTRQVNSNPVPTLPIALADILSAQTRLGTSIYKTPCARSETLSRITGHEIFLKL